MSFFTSTFDIENSTFDIPMGSVHHGISVPRRGCVLGAPLHGSDTRATLRFVNQDLESGNVFGDIN